jgi:GDPmannose 4,6-dehydratase/GDP-4-dehydro-6-deoxy-D-mannose reductase
MLDMRNILITGITGSGGSYLAEYILENQPEVKVFGLHRWHSAGTLNNIDHIKNKINIIECDLLDLSSIIRALQIVKPEIIFHLASFANVRKCFDTPIAVINNNIMGTANLLEGIRLICPETIIQMCSTSEVYGNPKEFPMTENHPLKPVNPYSVSKLAQESLAYAYHKSWGLKVIITRAFAYINPRRRDLFSSSFAYQVAEIEAGKRHLLYHGNLESIRTLVDVRDMMEAYWIACEKCEYGKPYNIGGVDTLTVKEFLNILIDQSKIKIFSVEDKRLLRPVDVTKQVPNVDLFYSVTKWKPKHTIFESIDFLLKHCRKEINL